MGVTNSSGYGIVFYFFKINRKHSFSLCKITKKSRVSQICVTTPTLFILPLENIPASLFIICGDIKEETMRAIWSGTISFGLVSIPIKLYSAVEQRSTGFKMICKKCKTPVHYKRFCEGCKEELSMGDIVKGFEVHKGEYVIFTQEELDKLKPVKSDRVEINEFVDAEEIDVIYYDKFYYCAPGKAKDRAYYLFKEVIKASEKVAIGTFVMREKEYICAIRDHKEGLLLSTLNYDYEIRDISDIKELKEKVELGKKELEIAIAFVDQLYEKKFDISDFHDTYAEQLREIIEGKKPMEIEEEAPAERPKRARDEDSLLELLKANLDAAKKPAKAAAKKETKAKKTKAPRKKPVAHRSKAKARA
jgi:DNA end-binding protein Ku